MLLELVERNVVVVAHDVNMSIFQPWWIVENDILKKEELQQGIVISPVAIEIPTTNFNLIILPNRIQMSFRSDCKEPYSYIDRVMGKIVSTLPHTPYSALGFNFHYNVIWDDLSAYEQWNERMFSCSYYELLELQKTSRPRFGVYLSYNVLDGRLKSKYTPITINREEIIEGEKTLFTKEGVQFNYNFHYDINSKEKPIEMILQKLKNWESALSLARENTEKAVAIK